MNQRLALVTLVAAVVVGFAGGYAVANAGNSSDRDDPATLTSAKAPESVKVSGQGFKPHENVPDLYVAPPPEPTYTATDTTADTSASYSAPAPSYSAPAPAPAPASVPSVVSGGGGGGGSISP